MCNCRKGKAGASGGGGFKVKLKGGLTLSKTYATKADAEAYVAKHPGSQVVAV